MVTERFELRVEQDMLLKIDEWRSRQNPISSRSEAMRSLVDKALGSPENDRLFEVARFQILAAAKSNLSAKGVDESYLFAWDARVYPMWHSGSGLVSAFQEQFQVSKSEITDLMVYVDKCWLKKTTPSFYDLENLYRVRYENTGWTRMKLINSFRYAFLNRGFDGEFWDCLLKRGHAPIEASYVNEPFSLDDIWLQ